MKQLAIIILVLSLVACSTGKRMYSGAALESIAKMRVDNPTVYTKDNIEAAWARAQQFISICSSMKIQVATDYVIETYNPPPRYPISYGYQIFKEPVEGGYQIEVRCAAGVPGYEQEANNNAIVAAYYIRTGKLEQWLVRR
jgi:hypothetical protein